MRSTPLAWTGRWFPIVGIPILAAALLALGAIFVHSASAGPEDPFPSPLARAHLIRIAIGSALFLAAATVDYRRFERVAPVLYGIGIALLLALLAIKWVGGEPVVRWFRFGGFSLQPSELVKLVSILLLARIIKSGQILERRVPWISCLVVAGAPFLMVSAQPDLGTALVLVPIAAGMLWVGGASGRTFGALGASGVIASAIGLRFFLRDYQWERLQVFLGIAGDGEGSADGYQLAHSMISIGSGGPAGKGLFLGTHHELGYLPEDHNDFIFGVIGEEWGLIGTLGTVLLFLALYLLLLRVAWRTREPFGRLVVVGVFAQLASQTLVNLSMTVGLLPVTGLPLPFVSFGGTSMLVTMLSLGIVVGIAMRPVESLHPDGLRAGTSDRQGHRRITIRRRAGARA